MYMIGIGSFLFLVSFTMFFWNKFVAPILEENCRLVDDAEFDEGEEIIPTLLGFSMFGIATMLTIGGFS